MKGLFEFMIIDLAVTGADDDQGVIASHERKGLGNAFRTGAQRLRGKLDRRAGSVQLDDS